jgi:metallophosphoesterase (TIGR00282 family)
MRILFIGDIVGEPGRAAVVHHLKGLTERHDVDLVIGNCENAAGGFGITPKVAESLFETGIHLLTSGNHIWDKKEALDYLDVQSRVLRPANYPPDVPGRGSAVVESRSGETVGVLNLQGRAFMPAIDCPFRAAKTEVARLKREARVVIIDMHAEATSEKNAMGLYLDGEVAAVVGTHTHVQTADERILPKGTAFITDVGMTGPTHSVIGVKPEQAINRFLKQMPQKFDPATGPTQLAAVLLDVDEGSGLARSITRIQVHSDHP